MTREIKYRVWDGKNFNHTPDFNLHFMTSGITAALNNGGMVFIDDDDLQQYTGKHDMNGDEIYEDDLLMFNDPDYQCEAHTKPYLVQFNEFHAEYEATNSMNFMNPLVWEHMEIVGNKHEKPELVEACK